MLREDDLLGPLEGVSGLVIRLDKGVDLIANLAWRGETRAGQGFGGENREPYLHLIEPAGMGRRKMEMDILVPSQPAVVFWLVGIEIVQDHMDLPAGMLGNHAVHEIQELDATAALIMAGLDQASGNIERGKQGRGPVTFVGMAESGHGFAIGQLQPALGALQSLDVRLLVDRNHHRILGRLQVEPDNVGSLLRKRRIGADTPTAPPRQRDLMPAQNSPDLMFGDVAQMPGQQAAVPAPVPGRRRLIQSRQDAPLMLALVLPGLAAARRIEQTRETRLRKAAPPLADRGRTRAQSPRHRLVAEPLGNGQDHFRPKDHALLSFSRAQPTSQGRPLLVRQYHFRRSHNRRVSYPLTYATRY